MAENNPFQRNEAEKLTNWVAQTLALKEAKVHTSDAITAVGQRGQVQIETNEMADTITPPTGAATSRAGQSNSGGGLTEEQVEEMIEDALENYVTKDFLNGKLLEYPTWEQANEAYVDWETYNGLLDTLENDYAKKDWVETQLEEYAKIDWVDQRLTEYPTWSDANNAYAPLAGYNEFVQQFDNKVAALVKANISFHIQCNGDGTVEGYLKWAGVQIP